MMSLELSTSSAQERPSKPKSRLLDFNESDESLEDSSMRKKIDLTLSWAAYCLANSVFAIYERDEGEDPLDWWRANRPQFPKGKASPSQWASCSTKKGLPFRREHAHAAFPQGQHQARVVSINKCWLWPIVAVSSDCVCVYTARLNYNKIIAINSSNLSK